MAWLSLLSSLPLLCLLPPSSSLSSLPSPSSSLPSTPSLRNTSLYPACTRDSDCPSPRRCFQYMCYPWQTSTGFRWCSKPGDCKALLQEEGGDGKDGACFRHEDRKNINFGICLRRSEMKKCSSHSDCPGGAAPVGRKGSLRCTNGWCGDPLYYSALKERPCYKDRECERLLTGEMCCFDFSSPEGWRAPNISASMNLVEGARERDSIGRRRCCHNPSGSPVIRPPDSISREHLQQLDKRIQELAPLYMDMVVCEALKYPMLLSLPSCRPYTTTTTSTISPRHGHHTSSSPSLTFPSSLPPLVLLLLLTVHK